MQCLLYAVWNIRTKDIVRFEDVMLQMDIMNDVEWLNCRLESVTKFILFE